MSLPPKWMRRLLIDPAIVLLVAVAVASLPVWIIVAGFLSRYVPGYWRILRLAWFLFLYLLVEGVGLILMFLSWTLSGFGWKMRSPFFVETHYRLLGSMLRIVVRSAEVTFKLRVVQGGERPSTSVEGRTRSILVFSRHAGPGDSFLLMNGLVNGYRRDPRIVLKEFLQWDPAVDVILNRLPTAFVPAGRKGGDALVSAIADLARTMDRDDAFVIFPEGANYTEGRRARAIQKLHDIGRPDLAERAEKLKQTLPPRSLGVMTALAAAPAPSDVFFIGHAGLETFITAADIWRAMPMDTEVEVRIWHYRAEDIPPPEAQEDWLYDVWAEIDRWIGSELTRTG
ncbi:MAG TPA: 1-acyl-sn-glycerol-3-phosphate acyltransferase [Acidimicrobiia bacterium]|nr:1-acyl-sn-glycerol-3-phosphate acyltransferase [Acidimicrobiia bacterium]